jgi:hypothetical protein
MLIKYSFQEVDENIAVIYRDVSHKMTTMLHFILSYFQSVCNDLGTHSKGLIWLKNKAGQHFPNHLVRKGTKSILLYSHGNGGSLGDFKSIVWDYAQW